MVHRNQENGARRFYVSARIITILLSATGIVVNHFEHASPRMFIVFIFVIVIQFGSMLTDEL